MRWARRRHQRNRRQLRRMVNMYIEAHRNEDFVATTRLEKLVPLETFTRQITDGTLTLKMLGPDLRRRVVHAMLPPPPKVEGFLADMLAREHIYTLGTMRVRYEERARQNMEAERVALQQRGGRFAELAAELGGARR